MCPDHIPVGFVTAETAVVSVAWLVPLTAVWAGLGGVRLANDLELDASGLEFVPQIFFNHAKVPV